MNTISESTRTRAVLHDDHTPYAQVQATGVSKRFADTQALDAVDLTVARGETLALLGPSGCGKTTLLRLIAGLDRPDCGHVQIGGRTVVDDHTFVAAAERRVGLVFQGGALFPHMSVADNVAYGLGRRATREVVAANLARVDLAGFEDRMPATLSGGQAQRVALARALAPQPDVILLDEPFTALDAELRIRVRAEVSDLLASLGTTAIFVTHDQEEAFVVGDKVAVLRDGRIVQVGTPSAVYDQPVDPWVAGFVGQANLVPATATEGRADSAFGAIPLASRVEGRCSVVVRPEHLRMEPGSAAVIRSVEYYGHDCSYTLDLGSEAVSVRELAAPRFGIGATVDVSYTGPATVAYPASA